MINYQIVNGNYTFKNKLEKRSVENIILHSLSNNAFKIFKNENNHYLKRGTLVLYSICKHHIPRLTIKTFEKVLGKLMLEKKIFCVYCPQAKKYVFGSMDYYKEIMTGKIALLSKNGFLKNHYTRTDALDKDGILEEDIERLLS
jgi:hypothetical protein